MMYVPTVLAAEPRRRVRLLTSVTMRARVIRRPECVQTRRRPTALLVTTEMLVRLTMFVPVASVVAPQRLVPRAINVMTLGRAIRRRAFVQTRQNRTAQRVTM